MKNKIFLILTMILMLSCLFVISASAEVTTYTDAPAKTNITVSTDDAVVFDDGFSCPSAYIFKDQTNIPDGNHGTPGLAHVLDFKFINEKTGKTYGIDNIVELNIPEGIVTIGRFVAYNRKSLIKVTIPYSTTSIGGVGFQNCSNLEECVFRKGGNPALTQLNDYMFSNCTNLKAFSMPDSVTKLAGQTQFSYCTNLTAVYLSKNLTTIECGGQQNATFDGCEKLYFVNNPFTTSDTAEPKPTIYYFPKNLSTMSNQCIFRSCKSLNDVLVFGEGTTTI
ncbi:MAG: leucine-rich repeat domain-containing protein, partial [Clostridia bacterium]|nr:leucine-rich repeat domain-containing protein [Clostridia bacterium]